METEITVYDWTELSETNLKGVLDPSMMVVGGKVSTINKSRLKEQQAKGTTLDFTPAQPRLVRFDRRFLLYRILGLLKKFNYLFISDLLREILAYASSQEELANLHRKVGKAPEVLLPGNDNSGVIE